MKADEVYMRRCLELAAKGMGKVAPNPLVGAVLVHEDRILAEGYHAYYGGPHAEVDCLSKVRESDIDLIGKCTLYVSLEPCDHHGKTPPCTDLIITSSIPKVVVGTGDLSEKVNGKGIRKLREHGVEVQEGCLQQEATEINRRFFTFHGKKRPYVILKWAQSADGFIGRSSDTVKISNEFTDKLVHKWRSEEAAILVGAQTAITDNPALTVRHCRGNNPLRVLLDNESRVPATKKIFNEEAPTLIFNNSTSSITGSNTRIKIDGEMRLLEQVMSALYQRNILSVIIEGGAFTLQSFIDEGLWDEARVIVNRSLYLEHGIPSPVLSEYKLASREQILDDQIEIYHPAYPLNQKP